jgi:hypothetical protein
MNNEGNEGFSVLGSHRYMVYSFMRISTLWDVGGVDVVVPIHV